MEVGITPHFVKRAKRLSPKERKLLDLRTEIFQGEIYSYQSQQSPFRRRRLA